MQGIFHNGDVVDLAAHMEMQKAQLTEQVGVTQGLHCANDFGGGEPKFRFISYGATPTPGAAAGTPGIPTAPEKTLRCRSWNTAAVGPINTTASWNVPDCLSGV